MTPEQKRQNLRLALILASVALAASSLGFVRASSSRSGSAA